MAPWLAPGRLLTPCSAVLPDGPSSGLCGLATRPLKTSISASVKRGEMKHRPRVFSGREGDEILAAKYLGLARLSQPEGRLQGCRLGLPGGSSALGGSGGLSADGTRLRAPTPWVLLFVPFNPIQPITKAVIGKCASRGLCQETRAGLACA